MFVTRKVMNQEQQRLNGCHADIGTITGIATGGPVEGFEGIYHICYFDGKGKIQAERELNIQKEGLLQSIMAL